MTNRPRRLKLGVLILIGLAAAALPLAGYVRWQWERRAHEAKRRVLAAERHQCLSLMRKLEETAAIDVTEEPLSAVLQRLTDQHGIPFRMEAQEFDWVAATRDLPITLDLPPIRLRCLLYWLLEPVGLQFYLRDDAVVIFNATQPERTAEALYVGAIHPVPPRLFSEEPGAEERMGAVLAMGGSVETEQPVNARGTGPLGTGTTAAGGMSPPPLGGSGLGGGRIGGMGGMGMGGGSGRPIPPVPPEHSRVFTMPGNTRLVLPGAVAVAATPYGHERTERLLAALDGWDDRRDTRQPVSLTIPNDYERRLAEKLTQATDLTFAETPLWEVRRAIHRQYGIGLMWDPAALSIRGLDDQHPVTFHTRNQPLGKALKELLATCRLAWCPREDVLWITVPSAADLQVEHRLYPVGDLLGASSGRLSRRALSRVTRDLQPKRPPAEIEVAGERCLAISGTEASQTAAVQVIGSLRFRPLVAASERRPPATNAAAWEVAGYDVRALVDPDFGIVDEAELVAYVQETIGWMRSRDAEPLRDAPVRVSVSRGTLILNHPAAKRDRIREMVACLTAHGEELRPLLAPRRANGPSPDERVLDYIRRPGPEWARALAAFHLLYQQPVSRATRAALSEINADIHADFDSPLSNALGPGVRQETPP